MDQNDVEGVYAIARGIYISRARQLGMTAFDQQLWNVSLHRALGGTRDGHTGDFVGGIWTHNGESFLLPQQVSGKQFDAALTSLYGKTWDPKGKAGPVYADGSPMPLSALRDFTPVLRPDGYYEFRRPDGTYVATKARDGVFAMDLAGQAARFPR